MGRAVTFIVEYMWVPCRVRSWCSDQGVIMECTVQYSEVKRVGCIGNMMVLRVANMIMRGVNFTGDVRLVEWFILNC